MLLKANKYRKDKKADCRQNELGSRIFMGRVFVDYAKCLHFYPSFSYGRIIAGEKTWRFSAPACPRLPAVRAVLSGKNGAFLWVGKVDWRYFSGKAKIVPLLQA